MAPDVLADLARPFDLETDLAATKPLTPAMKAQESRARKKKPGRPRVGLGAEKLRISMERRLLRQVDAYARAEGLSRSRVIADSLRRTMGMS